MIRLFLRQHSSWLLFLLVLQLIINLILFVDSGFRGVSFYYMNLVWFVLIGLFLLWRYMMDAKIMKNYVNDKPNYIEAMEEQYEARLSRQKAELQEQKLLLLERQDELLAWVHEMKSPLTAIQLIVEKMEQPAIKERLETEWLRLYLLLDQQLHATRLLTIEQDNRIEKVMLKEVLVQEVKALRSWCFEKQLALDLQQVDVEVQTDAKWLGFIVRQILSNAVKYSETGGEIRIYTTIEHEQLILHIQDAGIGIKKEDLPRVFRKSYTGTIGRETSAATGMGLYLAKQVADTLAIQLDINSTEQIGTTVHIRFPKTNAYVKTLA